MDIHKIIVFKEYIYLLFFIKEIIKINSTTF